MRSGLLRYAMVISAALLAAEAANGATPDARTPAAEAESSPAYADGRRDRKAWEDWFNALAIGTYRDGAFWWFGERAKASPGGCVSPAGDRDWVAGCRAAQQRLALPDIRWKTEALYALGWEAGGQADIPPEPITPPQGETTTATKPFLDGSHDRQAWEAWLRRLPIGLFRDGAFWWLDEHDKNSPRPCASPSRDAQWVAGCRAAQGRLAESDVRRTTEADYRMGWNRAPSP